MNTYRLALGTLTAAALQANPAYIVRNFPRLNGENWSVTTMALVNPGVTRVRVWGNGVAEMGNTAISSWSLLITYNQTDYLETTFFQGAPSAAVTIQTLNLYKGAAWEVYNCFMVRPVFVEGNVVQKSNTTFDKFRIDFLPGTLAAES